MGQELEIVNEYTSVSFNKSPGAADWGQNNGLIAFGACNSVGIFDPQLNKITHTYVGHTDRVNAVRWITKPNQTEPETELVSCSNDGNIIFWRLNQKGSPDLEVLKGHTNSVTYLDAVYHNATYTLVSTSGDSTIKIWEKKDDELFKEIQTIVLPKSGISFVVKLIQIPETENIMLLYSSDDDNVYILVDEIKENRQFVRKNILKGHEDWVRGIDAVIDKNSDIIIATSSQDTFIRLWRISARESDVQTFKTVSELGQNELIQVEETRFNIDCPQSGKRSFALALESVLQAHEGWVYSVHWNVATNSLLSSSIDKSIIIWKIDHESGIWVESVRLGEVGGNSLGFFGAKFSKSGQSVMAHGFQGSFHLWDKKEESNWNPAVIAGGHFASVKDISWEPQGRFLYSVSLDQTTRIHSPWSRGNGTWHELARPQVHGYDMQCLAPLTRFQFASAAEEKIVRVFQSPANFVENLKAMIGDFEDSEADLILKSDTSGASVPSLGLSNKSVTKAALVQEPVQKHIKDEYPENYFLPIHLEKPPTEETLMQNTLWPENQKLYGHGYEVFSLCATSDGQILASACKATTEEHARIILWNTSSWKQIDQLSSHQLTVTQMKFSPDDKYLLSVSRDRRFSVFERRKSSENTSYSLIASSDKKNGIHARIIWTCDWAPDSKYFCTGSRDGKLIAWFRDESVKNGSLGPYQSKDVIEFKNESVTALAFARNWQSGYLVAVGHESGVIQLCELQEKWRVISKISKENGHHLTVQKLMFRPDTDSCELASCGDDHLVRIYKIKLY